MKVSMQIQGTTDQLIVKAGKTGVNPHRGDTEALFHSSETHTLSFNHLSSHMKRVLMSAKRKRDYA